MRYGRRASGQTAAVRIAATAVLAVFSAQVGAAAADLEMLARVLIPAYMAQNFAALCVVDNPSFVEDTAGPNGHVHVYAKHVKDEISADLTKEDVEAVLRTAADTARSVLQKELRDLSSNSSGPEPERLARWCDRSAKPFVREVINAHFSSHAEVERIVSRAKRE